MPRQKDAMATSYYPPDALKAWLGRQGFFEHPFRHRHANEEQNDLPDYFVPTPYYDRIIHEDEDASSVFFAERGCGKSAHRIMVAAECAANEILAVEYTQLGTIPERAGKDRNSIRTYDHLELIFRAGLRAYLRDLAKDPTLPVPRDPSWFIRLRAFFDHFARDELDMLTGIPRWLRRAEGSLPSEPDWIEVATYKQPGRLLQQVWIDDTDFIELPFVQVLLRLVDTRADAMELESVAANELLRNFAELMVEAGFKRVYILVDGLDEPGPFASDLGLAVQSIIMMLVDLPLMEVSLAPFKWFLPLEMRDRIMAHPGVRKDRLRLRDMVWEPQYLTDLLQSRLRYFSDQKRMSLGQLSDDSLRSIIDADIVQRAGGNPRRLLELATNLLEAHVRLNAQQDLLSIDDWREALRRTFGEAAAESPPRATIVPLWFNPEQDSFFIGERRIDLADTPFDLLTFMYDRPNRVVSWVDFQEKSEVLMSEDSVRQNVKRIRKQIEPDPENPVYLTNVRGKGYRLMHTDRTSGGSTA
ncbi:MAG: winged helix-turn-helix transcriptional regulator [Anaerolineae bacterium]|nr:winged helix-turn-helix transcriptional regulator [Anaerolineae bacterium]